MECYMDVTCSVRDRKTRKDILTVGDAIRAHKSSKNHKLAPRSIKRDRTKSTEDKQFARERLACRGCKWV